MKPNWEDAPKDATHWAPETDDYFASWYKIEGSSWSCVNVDSYRVFNSPWYGLGVMNLRINELEPRPC